MGNPFVHIELHSKDIDRSKKFYSGLFDWKLEEAGMDYTMITVGEGTGGGMMKDTRSGGPDNWLPYILVGDVKESIKKARTLGGTVIEDITEIPDFGWYSVIKDPTGAVFGIWQPKNKM